MTKSQSRRARRNRSRRRQQHKRIFYQDPPATIYWDQQWYLDLWRELAEFS